MGCSVPGASPSSWGTFIIRLPCSIPTPVGLLASDHCDAAAWPLVCKKQRLPRKVFRSSIAWLSDSLFTLRSADYSNTTQNSLPVAGQALPDRISTRKVPMKGFKVVDYISFPFPKLSWRNCIDRTELATSLTRLGRDTACTKVCRGRCRGWGSVTLRCRRMTAKVGRVR